MTGLEFERAACLDAASVLFFPTDKRPPVGAFVLCGGCPILDACAAYALEHFSDESDDGVWGLTTPADRRAVRKGTAELVELQALNRRRAAAFVHLQNASASATPEPAPRPERAARPGLAQAERYAAAYAAQLGTDLEELRSASRSTSLVELRQLVAYLLCEKHDAASTTTGRALNRDHSTILHAVRRVRGRLEDAGAPLHGHIDALLEHTQAS